MHARVVVFGMWLVARAPYAQQEGVEVGDDNVLDGFKTGSTELDWFCWNDFAQSTVALMLRHVRKGMDEPVRDCTCKIALVYNVKIMNS